LAKIVKTNIIQDHYHVVYIKNDGTGYTSFDNSHKHDISLINKDIEVVDPSTGQVVGVEQSMSLDISEVDGHRHELEDIVLLEKKDITEVDKDKVLREDIEFVKKSLSIEKKSNDKAKESIKFYDGDQWDLTIKSILEIDGRAALTQNEIKPRIDLLSGFQRQNRFDIKTLPGEEGDAVMSDILNILIKNICNNCNYEYEETEVFEDSSKIGRGNFQIRVDFDNNIDGDIIIDRIEYDNVFYGKHNKKDASDVEYIGMGIWVSFNKLKHMFPDKSEEIGINFEFFDDSNKSILKKERDSDYDIPISNYTENDLDFVDYSNRKVKLIELQRKIYEKVIVISNDYDNFNYNITLFDQELKNKCKNLKDFEIINRSNSKIRIDLFANNILLDVKESIFSNFNIIPVYANKNKDNFYGKVETMKDPQRELNKKISQLMDILNKSASYGWFYDEETFPNKGEINNFINNSSKAGFAQKVSNLQKIPQNVQGIKFPNELANSIQISLNNISTASGIYPEMMGTSQRTESGIALAQKTRQGLVGNEYLFDNLSLSKKILGKLIIEAIQKVYTPERIVRIIENKAQTEKMIIAGIPAQEYDKEKILEALNTLDLTKYDIVITEAPNSPSTMYANFIYLTELAGRGVQIPPTEIIKFMPYMTQMEKDNIIGSINQVQELNAQQEANKTNAEVVKSQIAAQSKQNIGGK
jgi:hypothetical protein